MPILFARVQAAEVKELFAMPDGGELSEFFHPQVAAQFVAVGAAQPEPGWNYDGVHFSPPPPPVPLSAAQQARIAFGAGITITSAAHPEIAGTYALDPGSQQKIQALALYCQINNRFPAAQSALGYPDITGALKSFATPQLWQGFATAVADFVAALDLMIDTGAGTVPPLPVEV